MEKETLDVVKAIEDSFWAKNLRGKFKSVLAAKILEIFNDDELKILFMSIFMHVNCNPDVDFVIDLKDIWKWCGFSRKDHAKTLIKKFFTIDSEYKILLPQEREHDRTKGGLNKETIIMTVNTFKKFCLMARTTEASKVHSYFIKIEGLVLNLIIEQNEELVNQLSLKDQEIEDNISEMEKNILINSDNTPLVYIGIVEDNLVKFGYSKGIQKRVIQQHKKDFSNFILKYTIHSDYYIELEDAIKEACKDTNSLLNGRRVNKEINNKNQTELLLLDDNFTVQNLYDEIIKINNNIIMKKEGNKSTIISDLRKQVKELREENNQLRLLLKDNGIDIKVNTIEFHKVNEIDIISMRYLYKFLEDFVNNKTGIYRIINKDFYDCYYKFIEEEYNLLYLFTEKKFQDTLLSLPFIKTDRIRLNKNHPKYIEGKDNRVKGKKLIINDDTQKWISEQY